MATNKKKKSDRIFEFSCIIPYQFDLLCKLAEVDPHKVLYEFMANVGMESFGLGDEYHQKAMEYFLACGYGQHYYTPEDMRRIFKEMESISGLYPYNSTPELQEKHVQWRRAYYKFWFERWTMKYRRNK